MIHGCRQKWSGMKTEILKIKGDWQEVVDDCRATVGKGALYNEWIGENAK